MNKKEMLELLEYAKKNVPHPDQKKLEWTHVWTDGVQYNFHNFQSSQQYKKISEERLKKLEDFENFKNKIDKLIDTIEKLPV